MTDNIIRKRGRPRKTKVEPLVNDNAETLHMAQAGIQQVATQPVSVATVAETLTGLYTKSYKNAKGGSLASLTLLNPFLQNERVKRLSVLPREMSKEELLKALRDPQNNEYLLKASSWSLSSTNYLYSKILRQACDIPLYYHYKLPLEEDETIIQSSSFQAEDRFLDEWLDQFDVRNLFKKIALQVKREGKRSYILRSSVRMGEDRVKHPNFATLQELPSDWVKITGIGAYGFTVSFNMMYFLNPQNSPIFFSDYIQQVWDELINDDVFKAPEEGAGGVFKFNMANAVAYQTSHQERQVLIESAKERGAKALTYMFWVALPQDICFTFCSDTSHAWSVPDTASLFLNLQELTDYNTLAGLIASTPLTAILTGEADFTDNATAGADSTKINPETLQALQDMFNELTSTNTEAFFAPLKNLKLQNLNNTVNSSDILTGATQNFVSMSGEGGLIVCSDKPPIAQIKAAQKTAASEAEFVTLQMEHVLNHIVNDLIGTDFKWKIHVFGDIFTIDEEKKFLKETVAGGNMILLPKLLACEGMSVREGKCAVQYIKYFDFYKDFRTLTGEQQALTATQGVGRPAQDEDEIENDSTAQSQENGNDVSENKVE